MGTEGFWTPPFQAGAFLISTLIPLARSLSKIKDLREDASPETPDTAVEGATEGPSGFAVVILLLLAVLDFKP